MKKSSIVKYFFLVAFFVAVTSVNAQETYKKVSKAPVETYQGGEFYDVKHYDNVRFSRKRPKNVILMIGDGMGIAQVYAGVIANGGDLFLKNFKHIGFSATHSADNYKTDSAAGGTALSSGQKTSNGAIGVDIDQKPIINIREKAEAKGLATGVISTSAITHATPASFVAHQPQRKMYEEIAADFLNTDIDVFIGGGYNHFTKRKDGRNLANELEAKGYKVLTDMKEIAKVKEGKLAGLTATTHNGNRDERNGMLETATETGLNILNHDKDGFFMMVEGSQIDWGGHANNTQFVVEEMLDFDKAIAKALEFAVKDKNTLIVVTADHETGGFSLPVGSDIEKGIVKGTFGGRQHTGVVVPVFAFGPGAEEFTGFMDNTDIPKKISELLKLNK
jgi:alkaline phosphatase